MKPVALVLGAAGPAALLAVAVAASMTAANLGERHHGKPADAVRQAQAYSSERYMQLASMPFAAIGVRNAGTPYTARFPEDSSGAFGLVPARPNRIAGAVDAYTSAIAAFIKTLTGEPEELSR